MESGFDGITSVHYEPTDPGRQWVKDPQIVLDLDRPLDLQRILTPNVIRPPEGGYRMYYMGYGPGRTVEHSGGSILSARSPDAGVWEKEPGVRLDVFAPHATHRVLCPDVIPLPDGRRRMYFEAATDDAPNKILSAVSRDGLNWQPEPGVRFGDEQNRYGAPRCVYFDSPDGESEDVVYRLYFYRYPFPFRGGQDAGNCIVSAISDDGLTFREDPGVRIAQESELESYAVYAPEVIRLGDGTFRMYYAGWSEDPIEGRIFSAVSGDGLTWAKDPGVCLDIGGPWDGRKASEPCVTGLDDGRYRMFYEACDDQGRWRILSATSAV